MDFIDTAVTAVSRSKEGLAMWFSADGRTVVNLYEIDELRTCTSTEPSTRLTSNTSKRIW